MRRHLLGTGVFLALVVLIVAACDDGGGDYGGRYGQADPCRQESSCSTCTPVDGCGWCTFADGTGACVSDPDECDSAQTFTWAWDLSGCRVSADASVVGDGGASTQATGDGASSTTPATDGGADVGALP